MLTDSGAKTVKVICVVTGVDHVDDDADEASPCTVDVGCSGKKVNVGPHVHDDVGKWSGSRVDSGIYRFCVDE